MIPQATLDIESAPGTAEPVSGRARRCAQGLLFVLILALPLFPVPEYWITQMNYIGLQALVVLGLVLLTGVGGLTSFGQTAFVGIGAYATAYLTTQASASPWVGLAIGMGLTVCAALLLGWLTLSMSGHYLPLATIAWCLALYYAMGNVAILGRYDGIMDVPPIEVAGFTLDSGRRFYGLVWGLALLSAMAVLRLLDSRPGRIMRALNLAQGGGATMPEAMGASAFRHKVMMFVIAGVLAGLSGWLFAHFQRTVNPTPFGVTAGIQHVLVAVIGGIGSVWGAFAGALVVRVLEEQLQTWLPVVFGATGHVELVFFGVALVLVLRFCPQGLWPLLSRVVPPLRRSRDWEGALALALREQPATGSPLLEVGNLRKAFGGLVAVNDVSFAVRAGEIVGLIGPNGAGKSTTFNLVSGVLQATSGTVHLDGERIDRMGARGIARRGLSRTFQHVKLVADMTVIENVVIGTYGRTRSGIVSALLGVDRAQERRAFAEAERQLRRIGLGELMFEPAGNLALGPQRLVEIARALASDPVLLLLDEPAAGLRHQEKQALAQVLRQLKAQGVSLLLVEHDMDFVMQLTDRIVVMEFGQKLIEGTPAQVQASAAVRAAYLGTEH